METIVIYVKSGTVVEVKGNLSSKVVIKDYDVAYIGHSDVKIDESGDPFSEYVYEPESSIV
ncbi:hypothetical protein KKH23_07120 [Patescibacteria group bacterium]|nr:hypothetical protein [Patescibacteria group bacterium]